MLIMFWKVMMQTVGKNTKIILLQTVVNLILNIKYLSSKTHLFHL